MPTLIIQGKELVTSNNVNVYLQPLTEKIHVLWKGVKAFDAYSGVKLNLHAMCIWSTHNFLTDKLYVGCVIKGHVACPPCGLETKSQISQKLKFLYCGIGNIFQGATLFIELEIPSMGKHNY